MVFFWVVSRPLSVIFSWSCLGMYLVFSVNDSCSSSSLICLSLCLCLHLYLKELSVCWTFPAPRLLSVSASQHLLGRSFISDRTETHFLPVYFTCVFSCTVLLITDFMFLKPFMLTKTAFLWLKIQFIYILKCSLLL